MKLFNNLLHVHSRRVFHASLVMTMFAAACLAQNESLLIGPGDKLHIQVFDTPEMEQHPVVTDAGVVPLLFVGDVQLAGLTPGDASRRVEETLKAKNMMLHPQVAVTVESYATQNVYIMGQVTTPGSYPISTPQPVVDVLALAGGLTAEADRHITIERHSDPAQRVAYFLSNRSEEALNNNVLVFPGDTILVAKVGVVYVIGDVGRPGGYPMTNNNSQMTVLQAFAMAGSGNKTALLSKTRLIRKSANGLQDTPIQLAEMQKGKIPDIQMQPDDVLFIPYSWTKNFLTNPQSLAASTASALIYHY